MNTLISSITSQSFGLVHTSSPHVEALPLSSLNLMLRSRAVLTIERVLLAKAVARNERHPLNSPAIPRHRQVCDCGGSTLAEV